MTGNPPRGDYSFGAEHGGYFFLSYASTPPPRTEGGPDADAVVDEFFRDLSDAVSDVRKVPELDIGFCDRLLAPGLDREARVRTALGRAEVLVPLYSPRYFKSVSAGREWTVFMRRLQAQGVTAPGRRVVPVSWTPVPPGFSYPTGVDVPAAHLAIGNYAEDGLQTMYNLIRHRADYRRVVNEVAKSVVAIAEQRRVGPGATAPVEDRELDFPQDSAGPAFAIVIAAPDVATAEPGSRPAYGPTPAHWRPFGVREELTLAQDAASIAARFGFISRISSLGDKGDPFVEAPGVLLIDPWLATTDEGRTRLEGALGRLPKWALPVIVTGEAELISRRLGQPLSAVAAELAAASAMTEGESAHRAVGGVTSLEDFSELFPILVTDASRRYLRYGRVYPEPRDPSARPTMKGPHTDPATRTSDD